MFDAIGFTGVSTLISSIPYTSGATAIYFFPSAIYTPLMHFKRGPTKLLCASKGANKAPPSCTKLSFLFFWGISGFTNSLILSRFLLIFFFSWSLTLIFLLMILMTHWQIALIKSGFTAILFLWLGRTI